MKYNKGRVNAPPVASAAGGGQVGAQKRPAVGEVGAVRAKVVVERVLSDFLRRVWSFLALPPTKDWLFPVTLPKRGPENCKHINWSRLEA